MGFLDSQKLSTPEQDFGDYFLLGHTPGYTQTLMIQGGYHVYPVVILRYIDGGGVLRQWRVIGNGKTDVITDSWVFPLPYDLYAEVWMTGKEAGCMLYYLDYWQTPNRALWLPMILRN